MFKDVTVTRWAKSGEEWMNPKREPEIAVSMVDS